MYKILLIIIFFTLVGCASSPQKIKENTAIQIEETNVSVKVYEIKDEGFNQLKSEMKDSFIENITSHITDVDIEVALSKVKYNVTNVHDFKLKDNVQKSIGNETVNDSRKNTGMMIVAEKDKNIIVFNVFNRTSSGGSYANSLSEISMNLSPIVENENEIAYRISENEILYIKVKK